MTYPLQPTNARVNTAQTRQSSVGLASECLRNQIETCGTHIEALRTRLSSVLCDSSTGAGAICEDLCPGHSCGLARDIYAAANQVASMAKTVQDMIEALEV